MVFYPWNVDDIRKEDRRDAQRFAEQHNQAVHVPRAKWVQRIEQSIAKWTIQRAVVPRPTIRQRRV